MRAADAEGSTRDEVLRFGPTAEFAIHALEAVPALQRCAAEPR
jgi:hypothetical protein